MTPSYTITSRGGPSYGTKLEAKSEARVQLRTNDLDIGLGLLVGLDKKYVNVAVHRYISKKRAWGWLVYRITRDRIESMEVMS